MSCQLGDLPLDPPLQHTQMLKAPQKNNQSTLAGRTSSRNSLCLWGCVLLYGMILQSAIQRCSKHYKKEPVDAGRGDLPPDPLLSMYIPRGLPYQDVSCKEPCGENSSLYLVVACRQDHLVFGMLTKQHACRQNQARAHETPCLSVKTPCFWFARKTRCLSTKSSLVFTKHHACQQKVFFFGMLTKNHACRHNQASCSRNTMLADKIYPQKSPPPQKIR